MSTDNPADAGLLQIGEVADRVGLSLRTVRYYEEQGLLTPQTRTTGGFRLYAEEQVDHPLPRPNWWIEAKPVDRVTQGEVEVEGLASLARLEPGLKGRSSRRCCSRAAFAAPV